MEMAAIWVPRVQPMILVRFVGMAFAMTMSPATDVQTIAVVVAMDAPQPGFPVVRDALAKHVYAIWIQDAVLLPGTLFVFRFVAPIAVNYASESSFYCKTFRPNGAERHASNIINIHNGAAPPGPVLCEQPSSDVVVATGVVLSP